MTVEHNVMLAPVNVRGFSHADARGRAAELLERVGIPEKAGECMTMVVVTHEMGFAREVCDRLVFIDAGAIVEEAPPDEFFSKARSERAREFVDKIIHH
jgi:ABC-type polar amino acid transport system ATPase subunit